MCNATFQRNGQVEGSPFARSYTFRLFCMPNVYISKVNDLYNNIKAATDLTIVGMLWFIFRSITELWGLTGLHGNKLE